MLVGAVCHAVRINDSISVLEVEWHQGKTKSANVVFLVILNVIARLFTLIHNCLSLRHFSAPPTMIVNTTYQLKCFWYVIPGIQPRPSRSTTQETDPTSIRCLEFTEFMPRHAT